MKLFEVTDTFSDHARSFSGCTGGDLDHHGLWICGLEWGGGYDEKALKAEIKNNYPFPMTVTEDDAREMSSYKFNQSYLKILSHVFNKNDYKTLVNELNPLTKGSNVLHLNLYPIAFREDQNHLWEEWIFKITGFPNKLSYKAWCQQNRFPLFKKIREQYKPRLILCSGTSYLDEYLLAFFGPEVAYKIKMIENDEPVGSYRKSPSKFKWQMIDGTLFICTPFFGSFGLNSDHGHRIIGEFIKTKLVNN